LLYTVDEDFSDSSLADCLNFVGFWNHLLLIDLGFSGLAILLGPGVEK
jgi:hypothetical protein